MGQHRAKLSPIGNQRNSSLLRSVIRDGDSIPIASGLFRFPWLRIPKCWKCNGGPRADGIYRHHKSLWGCDLIGHERLHPPLPSAISRGGFSGLYQRCYHHPLCRLRYPRLFIQRERNCAGRLSSQLRSRIHWLSWSKLCCHGCSCIGGRGLGSRSSCGRYSSSRWYQLPPGWYHCGRYVDHRFLYWSLGHWGGRGHPRWYLSFLFKLPKLLSLRITQPVSQ